MTFVIKYNRLNINLISRRYDMNSKNKMERFLTEKIVFLHTIFILVSCIVFGALNIFTSSLVMGIIIIVAGLVISGLVFGLKKSTAIPTRGAILSLAQIVIILSMSIPQHEVHGMFPLMLASMVIASIYYNKTVLVIHWVIMDLASVIGLFLGDFFYQGASTTLAIKGIIGMNVGAFLLMYLVNNSLRIVDDVQAAQSETAQLLDRVQHQMDETQSLTESRQHMVDRIAEISATLNNSSEKMRDVASTMSASSEEQQATIDEITAEIVNIAQQTEESLKESQEAASCVKKSAEMLRQNNKTMQGMAEQMDEIKHSSEQIRSVVEAIEDIAFQTNILALNASIEAARAGAAGKGFAVVADEVRNLASKSSKAVESTRELIERSINAVERGGSIADEVLESMNAVIAVSEESARHAELITSFSKRQAESTVSVEHRMQQITQVVADNSRTSIESAQIAEMVANDAKHMDEIVRSMH